ncbi:unnamed protein product [Leptidea sinapis]|uniref:Mitochondrial import inner membrane translocase subunit TIM50 n=1 Tax=Leptidea sinapis TaxID=189913 RepID=A0A5E4Q6K7_9NEOP|nr:unnamed protein product [Leptidea sinapis]
MDASSIITQVSRDDEQLNNYGSERGPVPGVQHNEGDGGTPVSGSTPIGSKKSSGTGGFLRSLLCCWRGGRGKGPPSGNGTNSIDGRASPPLLVMSDHAPRPLLPPVRHQDMHKKCMVIDLDETLVHSSFKVPVVSWFDDMTDSELLDLIPFFEKLSKVDSVYTVLRNSNHPYNPTQNASPSM